MKHGSLRTSLVLASALLPASILYASELSFEERVKAQEAIERIYYSHQIGTTQPFQKAISREVLGRKVRTYLKESVALEQFWHTRAMRRISAPSISPVTRVCQNSPFLIQE